MAEKKEPMAKAAPQQTAEKKEPKGILYPAEELAKAAHRFNTKEECVVAALKYFGKKEATIKETEELCKTLYLIFDYPYKYYTFKHFEV